MPLDLAILGPDGAPVHMVPIRAEVHERMIRAARNVGGRLLLRMEDFYADTEYELSELPAFKHDVNAVLHEIVEDQALESVLQHIAALVDEAINEAQGLCAIAD